MKEDEYFNIAINYIVKDYIEQLYEKRATKFDITIDLTSINEINFKIASEISKDVFDNFIDVLFQNALEFAVANKNKDNLNFIKLIIKIILLEDNFILINLDKNSDFYTSILDGEDEDDIEMIESDNSILEHINFCINNNIINLPEDMELRNHIYDNFLSTLYSTIHKDFLEEYKDTEEMKKVKKLDPFFGLE